MEIPKRKFALEEKDLSIEADENNKIAEDKENRFLKKIQEEATAGIKHLTTDKVLDIKMRRDFQTDRGVRKMTGLYSVATPDPVLE